MFACGARNGTAFLTIMTSSSDDIPPMTSSNSYTVSVPKCITSRK
jgi:hypothetical protein